ncbi:hypothetical protein Bca4012_089502 [Brassica carinata]
MLILLNILHGNGNGYAEAYGSAETRFLKKIRKSVLEARFCKLPQDSDSDSGSEAESGHPMKLPCNIG